MKRSASEPGLTYVGNSKEIEFKHPYKMEKNGWIRTKGKSQAKLESKNLQYYIYDTMSLTDDWRI